MKRVKHKYQTPKASGFTLVELSIVILVVSLLLGMILTGATQVIQRARISQTESDLKLAAGAILGYAYQNGYLPCPDTASVNLADPSLVPDGRESRDAPPPAGSGRCLTLVPEAVNPNFPAVGYLPAADLGVASQDPWGTPYFYHVVKEFADIPAGGGPSFALAEIPPGTQQISIQRNVVAPIVFIANSNVAFVIFSLGPNKNLGLAAQPPLGALQTENLNLDNIYVSAPYKSQGNNAFDDILYWVSIPTLKAKMVEAGVLP